MKTGLIFTPILKERTAGAGRLELQVKLLLSHFPAEISRILAVPKTLLVLNHLARATAALIGNRYVSQDPSPALQTRRLRLRSRRWRAVWGDWANGQPLPRQLIELNHPVFVAEASTELAGIVLG
jgi:hypothetical protein